VGDSTAVYLADAGSSSVARVGSLFQGRVDSQTITRLPNGDVVVMGGMGPGNSDLDGIEVFTQSAR